MLQLQEAQKVAQVIHEATAVGSTTCWSLNYYSKLIEQDWLSLAWMTAQKDEL